MLTPQENHDIRIACRLELLPGDDALDKMLRAKDMGFDAVALPGRCLDSYAEGLKALAGRYPLPLSSLSLGFEGSLVSPSAERRRACRRSLGVLFKLCRELGVASLNMPPALTQDNPGSHADAASRDALLLQQLPEVAAEADACGVTLLLEPVNRYESEYLNSLAHAVALCRRAGAANLGITPDLFHMQMEELNVPAAIAAAGGWIKCVHVAENTRQEPGIGSMDFLSAFTALKGIGYSGYLELESRALSGRPELTLPPALAFLRRSWAAAGDRSPANCSP